MNCRSIVAGVFGITSLLALSPTAQAVTIVSYELAGALGNQVSQPPASMAAQVTGLSITRGSGLNAAAAVDSFNSTDWDESGAAAANDYFSFGFTVDPGSSVNLSSLILATRSSATGPGTMDLYYSGDGFTTSLHTFNQPDSTFVNSAIDLSALVGLTGLVEFRIYETGNTQADGVGDTGATGTFRVSDYSPDGGQTFQPITFDGRVVPEPSSIVLAAVGLAYLAAVARAPRLAAHPDFVLRASALSCLRTKHHRIAVRDAP